MVSLALMSQRGNRQYSPAFQTTSSDCGCTHPISQINPPDNTPRNLQMGMRGWVGRQKKKRPGGQGDADLGEMEHRVIIYTLGTFLKTHSLISAPGHIVWAAIPEISSTQNLLGLQSVRKATSFCL